jgi:hypothetical protein
MHDDALKVAALSARPYLPHNHGRKFSRSLLSLRHLPAPRYHTQRDTVQPGKGDERFKMRRLLSYARPGFDQVPSPGFGDAANS